MVKAAHSQQLQQLFETHLEETEAQIERLEECFGILGIQPRAKACKGMMGIVEEGEEVMAEGKKKDEHRPSSRVRAYSRAHDARPSSDRWNLAKAAVFPVYALRGRPHH
jgi:hypothetical protein